MLDERERPTGTQHTPGFSKRQLDVLHGTQHQCCNHRIEAGTFRGKALSRRVTHLGPRSKRTFRELAVQLAPHRGIGFNERDRIHTRRVMLEVEPSARAEFENVTSQGAEQFRAPAAQAAAF